MNRTLLAAMTALMLSACDKPATPEPVASETPTAQANAQPAAAPADAGTPAPAASAATSANDAEASAADEKAVDDRIDTMLGDHARYRAAIAAFQKAVADKDAAAVAAWVAYPLRTTVDGKPVVIDGAAAFVAQYDDIVTPAIAEAIVRQRYADLMINYKGIMFGKGEAWMNGICKDAACKVFDVKVIAIQPGS